jgi:hypothetical protein
MSCSVCGSKLPAPSLPSLPVGFLFAGSTAIVSAATGLVLAEPVMADRTLGKLGGFGLGFDQLGPDCLQRLICLCKKVVCDVVPQPLCFRQRQFYSGHGIPFCVTTIS